MAAVSPPARRLDRRSLLRFALAGAGVAATGPALAKTGVLDSPWVQQGAVGGVINESSPVEGPVVPRFERDLVIPAVLKPTKVADGVAYYDLEHRVAKAQILPAPFPASEVFTYTARSPGRRSSRPVTGC